MTQPPLSENEVARLEALAEYEILDTPEEAEFDDLTRIAASICGTPIATIGLVDADRQWFKSKVGLEVSQTPREHAFCARTILQSEPLIVPNALEDERFATNPLVTGEPNIRFYAGVPLVTSDGFVLGSLCVIDSIPRHISLQQIESLQAISRQVVRQIEMRRSAGILQRAALKHQVSDKRRRGFFKQIVAGFGLAAVILAAVGWVSYCSLTEQIATSQESIQSKNVSEKLESIVSLISDAEAGQRGYLLTGNDRYLEPYNTAIDNVAEEIRKLRELTADRPGYQREIETLEPLIFKELSLIKNTVNLRRSQGLEPVLQSIKIDRDNSLMDYIRSAIASMKEREARCFQVRSIAAEASSRKTIFAFSGGQLLSFLVLAVVYYFIYREITFRYRTERQLELERDFTAAIFETAGDLIMVLDSEGKIIRFNRACESITGYSLFEVGGKVFWELFSIPAEVKQVKTAFFKLQENPQVLNNYENTWAVRDGSTKLISWTTATLRKPDNTLEYAIFTGTDITASKRAEQRQAVQHAITRILAESSTVEEAVQNIIKSICKILGWDLGELWRPEGAELMQQNLADFAHPDSSLICTNFWSNPSIELPELMANIGLFRFDFGVGLPGSIWQTGLPKWISDINTETNLLVRDSLYQDGIHGAFGFPVLDDENLWGVLVFYSRHFQKTDKELLSKMASIGSQIGQFVRRKQAELELKNIQQRLQAIMDNISTLIFIKDADGCFQFINRKFERLFNITNEQIQGKTDCDLFGPEIADTVRQNDLQVLRSGIPLEIEEIVSQEDGLHTYLSVKFPLQDPVSDRFNAVCGIATDITARKALRAEQEKVERLLLNILPSSIAARLKQEQSSIADSFTEATVLFADIVGFTKIADCMPPTDLVYLLNEIFSSFDLLTEKHGLEKIKTIGDAYMVAGGIPIERTDCAEAIALLALDMQREIANFNKSHDRDFNIRIGINTGPVVAGVIGIKKFIYDLWGDAVNTASRMESHSLPGEIQLTEATYQLLADKFVFEERGAIDIKGKGLMRTYFLKGKKASSIDFLR